MSLCLPHQSQGRMKLTGKTELGEYSIDLDKVRTITPLK